MSHQSLNSQTKRPKMTSDQIKLVKNSWKQIMAIDPTIVGDAFYSKLFNDQPELKKMFPKEMELQYKKLIDMLSSIIISLDEPNSVMPELKTMGQRHLDYGVKNSHYAYVAAALLWTLSKALGSDWTNSMEKAWQICLEEIIKKMMPT